MNMKALIILSVSLILVNSVSTHEHNINVNRRIIGGDRADHGQFPYQVVLRNDKSDFVFCGGTIIHKNFVLTAAHCFHGNVTDGNGGWKIVMDIDIYKVHIIVGGVTDLTNEEEVRQATVKPTNLYIHKKYDDATKHNDIALLRVEGNLLEKRGTIEPKAAQLTKTGLDSEYLEKPATVSGYGRTKQDIEKKSSYLMYTEVNVLPNHKCRKPYEGSWDNDMKICAGLREGGQDACQGDSGGPLVVKKSHNFVSSKYVLVGIVSGGEGCGVSGFPGVYTRVSNYNSWIDGVIDKYEKDGGDKVNYVVLEGGKILSSPVWHEKEDEKF